MKVSLPILQGEEARLALSRRPGQAAPSQALQARTAEIFGQVIPPAEAVRRILASVRSGGAAALIGWNRRIDRRGDDRLYLNQSDLDQLWENGQLTLEEDLEQAIQLAVARVTAFHRSQPAQGWIQSGAGGTLGQLVLPLERVGIYVPAGSAPLISSLIMTAVPALVAGVTELVLATPPGPGGLPHPALLHTARQLGIGELLLAGGAQAIAAMAYGLEGLRPVDKVVGPGNTFVVLAQQQIYGETGAATLPGPTETLIVADGSARVSWVAADLLAQAEHVGAQPVLVSLSTELLAELPGELERQLAALPQPNRSWAEESIGHRTLLVRAITPKEAFELANRYAPEHLCLLLERPWDYLGLIRNAGGIFVGESSMEALGDYLAGPSHVMPTGGTARFASPINLRDFQKIISLVGVSAEALQQTGRPAATLARAEGLEAHARAILSRLDQG